MVIGAAARFAMDSLAAAPYLTVVLVVVIVAMLIGDRPVIEMPAKRMLRTLFGVPRRSGPIPGEREASTARKHRELGEARGAVGGEIALLPPLP